MNKLGFYCSMTAALLIAASGESLAQQEAVRIQQALDKPIELVVPDAPIGEVFRRLSAVSGIRFAVDPSTLDCLPYGDQTRLEVKLKNVTLRKALSPMLAQQALQWAIEDDLIRILPSEALSRMGRRATYDELVVLGKLYSSKLPIPAKGETVIDQLRKVVGNEDLKLLFHGRIDEQAAMTRADRALPCAAAVWLDMLCHANNCTWYLREDKIIVLTRTQQVRRQLRKSVSLHYQNAELVTVLLDLARQGRFKLMMDPGVMNMLPSNTRSAFNLDMSRATIAQAFDVIGGVTGLKFTPGDDGVSVEASEALKKRTDGPARPRRRRPSFLIKIIVPRKDGSHMEIFLLPDELPPEVLKTIEAERDKLLEELKVQAAETPPAATQPQ